MPEAKATFRIQDSVFGDSFPDPSILNAAPLSISRITLSNFRNYANLRLGLSKTPVVLMGANGSGKTNLLEAISLLVPGRGLRRCSLADLQNRASVEAWAVAIELRTDAGPLRIGTGRDNAVGDSDGERRLVHIDGKPTRSQNLLAEHIAMAWITPDMDRLLAEGPSARRKFLDRLVYSFDPTHGSRVSSYEKAMRERLYLLREGVAPRGGSVPCEGRTEDLWLSVLENEMAQAAVAIAAARRHMICRLRTAIAEGNGVFPQAEIEVRGAAEDMLETMPALLVEDALRGAFACSRKTDAMHGTCATGAHRSDLRVVHRAKNCPAESCSAGEQKALMIALMLAYVRLLAEARRMTPLFLLDDIAAHLDYFRRMALFDEVLSLGCQAWFTGTDRETFARLASAAQTFQVENGAIV